MPQASSTSEVGCRMPNFEVYLKPDPRPTKPPLVTIRGDSIHLNKTALDLLGRPRNVELLYDRNQHVMGVSPAGAHHTGAALTVRPTRDGGGGTVTAPGFAADRDIPAEHSRRWPAHLDGGVLCVDLNGPSEKREASF